jgi:hypothetical protein
MNSYTQSIPLTNVKPAVPTNPHSLTAVIERIRDFDRQLGDILVRTDSAASQISGTDNRDEPLDGAGPSRPDGKVGEAHSCLDALEARLASIRWHLTRLEGGL